MTAEAQSGARLSYPSHVGRSRSGTDSRRRPRPSAAWPRHRPAKTVTPSPRRRPARGPFYIPNTPERTVVREPGVVGTPLVLTGRVLSPDCRPLAGVVLDFWNCDDNSDYGTQGFKLRGHQFTDEKGTYRLETVKPADYEAGGGRRTPHIHVKLQGRGTRLLTTQIFFPGEPLNSQDWLFRETLTMELGSSGDGTLRGRFNFVLA